MALPLPSADPKPLPSGLHRTDAFHREPLFAVRRADGAKETVVVRRWEEAHALHGPARPDDVNPAYVAALIRQRHDASLSPYLRIQRLQRAHHVWIDPGGRLHSSPYDPLAGGAGPMAAEELHEFLRLGLLDHLRRALEGEEGPIGCEHSSGLDSNAVVGALVHGAGVHPERLHTWSLEAGGEGPLLEQFRPFHGVRPGHCHRSDPADRWLDPVAEYQQQLKVYGAPAQIGGNPSATELLSRQGCRLLFSGFGGDQAISHNANNVPTDLVAAGRWGELVAWVGGRRRALKVAAGRTLALGHRRWAEGKVWGQTHAFSRCDLLERSLTEEGKEWLAPHLRHNYPWELDGYLRQGESIRRRVLADWVAMRVEEESRMATSFGMVKAFPLLDERLIGTLLQQEPLLFGEGQRRGRLLHRQAFAPFLPPLLRANPSKARALGEELREWREQLAQRRTEALAILLGGAEDWHPALARWWDVRAIRREGEAIVEHTDPLTQDVLGTHQAIATLASLSHWRKALDG